MSRRLAALLTVLSVLLAGCWDRTEIEDTAFITSLGVDAAGEREYLWTFRLSHSEQTGAAGHTGREDSVGLASTLITVRAFTLVQAMQLVQASLGRILSVTQLRFIVIGEELGRRGLAPLAAQLVRNGDIRLGVGFAVAKGRAVDTMQSFDPTLDTNPVKVVEGLLLVQKRMHLSPPVRFQQFYASMTASGEDPVTSVLAVNPLVRAREGELPSMDHSSLTAGEFPRQGGDPVEFAGAGVFRDDRLVGFLTVNETAALLALRGGMGKIYSMWPDPREPGEVISIRLGQENKPQIRTSLAGGRPRIHIRLQIEGEIMATTGQTNYAIPENRRVLEQFFARYWEEQVISPMLRRVVNEWGADPFGFGHRFRKRFRSLDQWLAWRWEDRVRNLEATLETDLFIRRFGLLEESDPRGTGP